MIWDENNFSGYRTVSKVFVRMAGGALERVKGIGSIGPLNDVLHVPNLIFNLVSEPQLAKEGMSGEWKDNWKVIRYPDGRVFITATLNDMNLYVVNPMHLGLRNPMYNYNQYEACASKVEAIDLLHRTWGHISFDRLQDGIKTGHVTWTHPSLPVNFRK